MVSLKILFGTFEIIISAIGCIVFIVALSFILDDCYNSVKMMMLPLQVLLVAIEERSERQKIENVINDIKGCGFSERQRTF